MLFSNKKYKSGDKRIIKKFLFIPKMLEGQWRWLCFARIEQQYHEIVNDVRYWSDVKWINSAEIGT